MDLEEDVDDPMEIDDTIPNSSIIERSTEDLVNLISDSDQENVKSQDVSLNDDTSKAPESEFDKVFEKDNNKSGGTSEKVTENGTEMDTEDENQGTVNIEDESDSTESTEKDHSETKTAPTKIGSNNVVPTKTDPTKSQTPAAQPEDEDSDAVVVLDDDDEDEPPVPKKVPDKKKPPPKSKKPIQKANKDIQVDEFIDLVDKPSHNKCVNTLCTSNCTEYLPAPVFCLSYFRVKQSKSHKEEICEDCYNAAVIEFDKLATTLTKGECILNVDIPLINETVQIEDSDDSDSLDEDNYDYIDEENFHFIKDNIDDVMEKAFENFDAGNHLGKELTLLMDEFKTADDNTDRLANKVKELRTQLDGIQINLYNQFRPDLRELKAITIVDDSNSSTGTVVRTENGPSSYPPQRKSLRATNKTLSYSELNDPSKMTPKIDPPAAPPAVEVVREPPLNLPAIGEVTKPMVKAGEIYYVIRENNASGPWVRARLISIIGAGTEFSGQIYGMDLYKLVELKKQIERLVNGKNIAYPTHCNVRLGIGTRVISVFKESTEVGGNKKSRSDPYYPGVVGEAPYEGNNYRYLIFFDIGYAQYVSFMHVHLVFESSKNVWEDMALDSRAFIKKYLESQDRPMVKLSKDQTVRTEYNGKWWMCTVMDVDCSLVKVFFDGLSRTEWIYRGSRRLSPMFREEQAATKRHSGLRTSRKLGPNESAAVVQYTRPNDANIISPEKRLEIGGEIKLEEPTGRAVARKSTTRPHPIESSQSNIVPFLPPITNSSNNTVGPASKIMYFTPRDQVITKRAYKIHNCSTACKSFLTHNFSKLRGHNPLSKPLLCGWARMTQKAKGRKEIIYKAPCGRLLRNIADVHYYLRLTESEMTVDLFDFNHMVRCLAEFSVECKPDPVDLSKGLEMVSIPVINGINNDILDFVNYATKRVPMQGVNLNTDPEFLCGCDCDDDCIDKTKCSCWKLTLEGTKYIGKNVDPQSIGYIYRRLPEQLMTGIYECNITCKCKQTCLNRVVQNPLSLKLQVFKTHNRGWGIRCLNDVPQGTFVCIYAGLLHTETMANEDGMAYGDEYFAELDYIETVEKYKEDYEAEAYEDEEDRAPQKKRSLTPDEEDEESSTRLHKNSMRYMQDNDFVVQLPKNNSDTSEIRTRSRRRNQEEPKKVEPKLKPEVKVKPDPEKKIDSSVVNTLSDEIDTVTISDDEDEGREVLSFNPKNGVDLDEKKSEYPSIRDLCGPNENVYIMDAKNAGNIGRFLNHSCSPNVFVQNVFVDTQDPRFPWVAFFSSQFIRAGTELTWNYNYDIGSVPGRVLYCQCASLECKGRLL